MGHRGFTLVESIIALVLSSLVIMLVSTTFLVQNRYQARQVALAAVHDYARAATEVVASDLRSSMRGGIILAANKSITVRSPVAVGAVCGHAGTLVDVYLDGGVAQLDIGEVAGAAIHRAATGTWDYERADWSFLNGGSLGSAARCAGQGADTTGVSGSFHAIRDPFTGTPAVGDLVMLFRETTYSVAPSVLEPRAHGLFREPYGRSAVEVVSGLDSIAEFRYRTGGTTYQAAVTGTGVPDIDAVRLVFEARRPGESGPGTDATFGWGRNVLLRNVP